ncbi:MAG: sigma-70 family RNA polymerase sigma factor [Deltaproteobacteria bacterium]|nr:sigma-70 family RNA polymerase sigma factor [Deltaproteobacteria bacterium]
MAARDPLLGLAREASRGDADAMGRLLAAVGPAVHRVARTILGVSNAEACDAAQESLVAFATSLERFRGDSGVLHYACRVALNVSISARRRAAATGSTLAAFRDEAPGSAGAASCSDDELIARRRRDTVRALLDTLPEPQAEALALRFVLDYSLREVADATGVSENTVRSRLRLAKEALQRRIARDPLMTDLLRDTA